MTEKKEVIKKYMKTTITATIDEVLACESAVDQDQKPAFTKQGKPLFQLLVKSTVKVKVGTKEMDASENETVKSEIEIKPGAKNVNVELIAFHMPGKNGNVNSYYRVIKILNGKV